MLAAIILLSLISAVLVFYILAYKRQVKMTCRRLAFMSKNETNMQLPNISAAKELNELAENINNMLDIMRKNTLKAKENENALKEAITNLSHDIRTPLTSLDGYFQLLMMSGSDEERSHYTNIIQVRIASLKNMLEELFSYTKLQNENFVLPVSRLDFSRVVLQTVFSFYNEFKNRHDEPETNFSEESMYISGNPEALQRILQNIIKNALLHGEKQIIFELKKENGNAVFICSNHINPDSIPDADMVFTRFYKADKARTHMSSGLGLAIAKGLTDKMNGSISASCENSIFKIRLEFKLIDNT